MSSKLRITVLLFAALALLGALLLVASLVSAQDYEHPIKPTSGGPALHCDQFQGNSCFWLVTETPVPVSPVTPVIIVPRCNTVWECLRLAVEAVRYGH